MPFESEEMKRLLNMEIPDYVENKRPEVKYDSNALMPDWILSNPEWKSTRCDAGDNNMISDILQIPFSGRAQEQSSVLVKWLMSGKILVYFCFHWTDHSQMLLAMAWCTDYKHLFKITK